MDFGDEPHNTRKTPKNFVIPCCSCFVVKKSLREAPNKSLCDWIRFSPQVFLSVRGKYQHDMACITLLFSPNLHPVDLIRGSLEPLSCQHLYKLSQISMMTPAKTPAPQRFLLASLACMDAGQGCQQVAKALRLYGRKHSLSCLVSLRHGLASSCCDRRSCWP